MTLFLSLAGFLAFCGLVALFDLRRHPKPSPSLEWVDRMVARGALQAADAARAADPLAAAMKELALECWVWGDQCPGAIPDLLDTVNTLVDWLP